MKALCYLQRLFGFGAAKPRAARTRAGSGTQGCQEVQTVISTPQSGTAEDPTGERWKQKSDRSRTETKTKGPPPGGPAAAPGVRWPGERQPGTRKRGTPDDELGPY